MTNASKLVIKEDPEILELAGKVIVLEMELTALEAEKAELERQCRKFEVMYYAELGDLISEILTLKNKIASNKARINPDLQKDADDAQADFNGFFKSYSDIKKHPLNSLSDEEAGQLKDYYRKAVKLCHPDKVRDDEKGKAAKIFNEVNACYRNGDLVRLKQIYEELLNGAVFELAPNTNDKMQLKRRIVELTGSIQEIKRQLSEIRGSDTYKVLIETKDMGEYLAQKKMKLIAECTRLHSEVLENGL